MTDKPQPAAAMELFYSYSHKDEEMRDTLEEHLSMLKRKRVISNWHDRGIGAGREWAGEINEHLKSADIILLLISSSFLASDYCYDVELGLAMERHESGEARVIPIILRPCDDWTSAPFGKLQALPKNALPVTKWPDRDEAFADIAKGIRKAAEELNAVRAARGNPASDVASDTLPADSHKTAPSLIPRPPVVGFVARRDEQGRDIVERLREELAPEKGQVVSLWGPGGAGKTTLAAEVVRATEVVFRGRVAWASSLRRVDFNLATLLDEIATQLGREDLRKLAPEPKAAEVAELVGAQPTLVVLDNFETITAEEQARCLDFLAQSAACPALITTRSFINRDDVYNVPLAAMTMEEARDFLQRLVERTRKPSNFGKLDRDDLIRRCEANPLVLQWVVRQIDLAKRPQDVLNDLAQGEGDAAKRVFTRSFNLPQVGEDGRDALLALALFTPHASHEALAEVAGFGQDMRRLGKAVESLSTLWLVETTEGNERLFLRGLTRELAKSRLSKDERAIEFHQRFVAYFLRYAVAHDQPTPETYDLLEPEKDNLLSATDAALALGDWMSIVRMAYALATPVNGMLSVRGYWDETLRVCDLGLKVARSAQAEKHIAAMAHNVAVMYQNRGEPGKARRLYGESLEIKKLLGNQHGIAYTLGQLGNLAYVEGELVEAQRLYDECLEISKQLGDQSSIATALHQMAMLARERGELDEARRLYGESLEIYKRLGRQYGIAVSLCSLGLLAEVEGNKKEAVRLFRESLHIFEKLRSPYADVTRRSLERVETGPD